MTSTNKNTLFDLLRDDICNIYCIIEMCMLWKICLMLNVFRGFKREFSIGQGYTDLGCLAFKLLSSSFKKSGS
jgi:hypothetical protein